MSSNAAPAVGGVLSPFEQLRYAQDILRTEAQALDDLSRHLDAQFCRAVELIYYCSGSVIVSGMGKAGLVGQKIAATLSSTGTRSHYLHPAEAIHGDLGRVHHEDLVLMLSQSGETEEVVRLLPPLSSFGIPLIAITGSRNSSLGRAADVTLELGPVREACALGLAPTTSTTAMLALGDALALVVSRMRRFRPEDFARFHPGGSLGRKLSRVDDLMRPLAECRVARRQQSVRQVLVDLSRPGRRSGAVMVVDDQDRLVGIFTDSDLARLFERRREEAIDCEIGSVMTPTPAVISSGVSIHEAISQLARRKISELPVVDGFGRPVGLIDVTDLVGLIPEEETE